MSKFQVERRCDACRYGVEFVKFTGPYRGGVNYQPMVMCRRNPEPRESQNNHWCFEFRPAASLWTRLTRYLKELFA